MNSPLPRMWTSNQESGSQQEEYTCEALSPSAWGQPKRINWCWRHLKWREKEKQISRMLGTSEQEVAFWCSLSLAQRRQLVGEKKHVILQSLRKKHLHKRNCPCCAHRKLSFDVNAGLLIWIPCADKKGCTKIHIQRYMNVLWMPSKPSLNRTGDW